MSKRITKTSAIHDKHSIITRDTESGFEYDSDSESDVENVFPNIRVQRIRDKLYQDEDEDEDEQVDDEDEEDEEDKEDEEDDADNFENENEEEVDDYIDGDGMRNFDMGESIEVGDVDSTSERKNGKIKKLTSRQLQKEQKRIKRTGVCYLSRIPPYMKPATLRSILSRFGKIDRLFLKPEDSAIYHKRVKYGGNKKKNFTEGWVEFVNKKDAKMCASTLNANKLGGRKTSYYYDDVINMKYLSGFKWFDLTQQIAKENEVRQAKLSLELSQQQKLNKTFVNNVEKSKLVSTIQRKRKERDPEHESDSHIRRSFKQRKVTSTRADADEELKARAQPDRKLSDVLSKVF
ncbi:predicted protein [Scheffersomyces stipitis CBS 6054]|uniref:Pre-rRNA-processing protein ESF2 n=1 Tax=Scheffersomyces stipitis (strain ATCC 58785 / CBS 6054 / NBRC 10063 / NRRL Y-11545) TaxID=322104 RepID=ESF2_PICST|nr:predicted protein [Scheffersomyces stipitis CBS 6054]A3LVD5.2 RecName: Full=Pre-rRNA-processing protein ESF2; AltName: Full=18S rRNA factor 2 [Scheffersomyces stipitis CBS 6054]ABN67100.2 predicted protein [Scheffersomyces stipitis CBS 6054]